MANDDQTATLEEWRVIEQEMQAGHALRDGGKPFTLFSAGPPERAPGRVGVGLCECSATSRRLPSDVGRRRWHGEHLDSLGIGHRAVADAVFARRAEANPVTPDPGSASITLAEAKRIADALQFACRLPDRKPDFTACGGPAAEAYWEYFTPARISSLLDVLTTVAAELDERGRIGRTLLTGSYPVAANLARRECIEQIGRAINGGTDG